MKTLTTILFLFLLLTTGTTPATAQQIKIKGGGFSTNRIYLKTEIKGHKMTLRTPKLSKNKYLKLVNIMY